MQGPNSKSIELFRPFFAKNICIEGILEGQSPQRRSDNQPGGTANSSIACAGVQFTYTRWFHLSFIPDENNAE